MSKADAFISECTSRGVTGTMTEQARDALLAEMAARHGVTREIAEQQLLEAAKLYFAVRWEAGLAPDEYQRQYAIRMGRCIVWGEVIRLADQASGGPAA